MAEETVAPEAVQEQAPVVEESGLPSDVEAREAEPQTQQELPDGWKSVDEMAAYIKEMKDKYAQLNDKIAREKKGVEADVEATKAEVEKEQIRAETINSIVPQFVENGMNLTDEMAAKIEEAGLTREQVELNAYKYKDARAKNAAYVGGEENFVQIMEFARTNMNEEEHKSLAATVEELNRKGLSTQPLMLGLQAMYEKAIQPEAGSTDRIRGEASVGSIKPYETKQELFRDREYIQGVGKNDSGAIAKYRQRLAATPESVWRG